MGKRWTPSASQKRAYVEKMKESDELFTFINSTYPIREGCFIKWVDKSTNNILEGEVITSSYGKLTNQHTFTILLLDGTKKSIKGRNIYDRILEHKPGEIARDRYNPLNK